MPPSWRHTPGESLPPYRDQVLVLQPLDVVRQGGSPGCPVPRQPRRLQLRRAKIQHDRSGIAVAQGTDDQFYCCAGTLDPFINHLGWPAVSGSDFALYLSSPRNTGKSVFILAIVAGIPAPKLWEAGSSRGERDASQAGCSCGRRGGVIGCLR